MNLREAPPWTLALDDPLAYDEGACTFLWSRYAVYYAATVSAGEYAVAEAPLVAILSRSYDPLLARKQLTPLFCAAEMMCCLENAEVLDIARAYLLMKTVPLNALDSVVDGAKNYQHPEDASDELGSLAETALYALASAYAGLRRVFRINHRSGLAMSLPISEAVTIMFMDRRLAYDHGAIVNPTAALAVRYTGELDWHLGSAFHEATAMAIVELCPPGDGRVDEMRAVLRGMRRLRQIVDEIADVCEDVRGGRLTYPVLRALQRDSGGLADAVRAVWNGGAVPDEVVRDWVDKCGGYWDSYRLMQETYERVGTGIQRWFPEGGQELFLTLASLKRAFAERLRRNKWRDVPADWPMAFRAAVSEEVLRWQRGT